MENKSKSEIRRIEHVKECERDREFDKWYVSKMEKASEMFNGKQDGLMIAIKPICKSAWLEARKGYVKVEDVLKILNKPMHPYTEWYDEIFDVMKEIKSLESKTTLAEKR